MNSKLIMGVDPGLAGAIAIMESEQYNCLEFFDMPVLTGTKGRKELNGAELARYVHGFDKIGIQMAYVEAVHPMPKQGVSSMFSFGMSFGIIRGILSYAGISITLVPSGVWKKRAGLIGKDKDYARTLAQRLYPRANLSLKKHIGRADALLIARFGDIPK